jgi:hypothetical protein
MAQKSVRRGVWQNVEATRLHRSEQTRRVGMTGARRRRRDGTPADPCGQPRRGLPGVTGWDVVGRV